MGATYTRQSTYADGDTITADHTNDEFDQILAAFAASTGHTHDGTAAEGGPVTKLLGTSITIGNATSGTDITVTFDGESNDGVLKWMEDEDYFEFSDDLLIASTEKIQFRDTGLYINSSADGQLDIVADTEIQIAATTVDINGLVDISGNLSVGGNLDVTGTFDLSDANFTNAGDIQLDSISGDADTNTSITFSGSDVITVATGGSTAFTVNASQLITASAGITSTAAANTLGATSFNDANITNVGSIALDTIINDGTDVTVDSSGDIILDADGGDVFVKDAGTTFGSLTNSSGNLVIKSGTTTALTFSGANATLAGDLTISGDDLTMGTNTAGALLIADGTNFNPTVVGDLSAITTVAADDVFLAVDTSGGGLKKITRSAIVSGLAAGELSNILEDTSPQLGGNLDLNGNDIVTTSNATLDLAPNGTGTVVVRGNTNSGAIVFNCESNSHGQKVYGQPHSATVTNTLMLPAGADSTLVSLVSADTLTNKTLTAAKIVDGGFLADANGNELVVFQTTGSAVNQLEITNNASGSDPILAATGGDTNIGITLTPKGTGVITIAAGNLDYGGTAVTSTGAELNIMDGGTSATSTTVVDADRVVMNDNGTMVQVAVTDLAAYFDDEITAMPNLITTAATTVGALDSGSITSGFGTINIGSSAFTTTGTVNFGSLADGTVTVTAFADEDDMSSDSATLVPTQQSVKAYVDSSVASAATKGFAIAMAIVFG